ncbi:GIY-YIG nuclease family protein [Bradyrhizobium jicamae]|uniref:GIY-YIG nuclease family protein n=1 Tax=Bradyrhizobium jicamae TaxID=280332 RepID=A0ABS5FX69_9BRAD|nr:GIY-YIG nuclease family protein [Bradyrhizobium jicamae]MBR0801326.1 GIY-YIG nuclease family protein [Bradyrhizobium jicamae]
MAYVYILQNGTDNIFKIGRTIDIEARLRQLRTGNPQLTVFQLIETDHEVFCESYLHKRLGTKQICGGSSEEFFAVTPAELEPIIADAKAYLVECLPMLLEAERMQEKDSDGSTKIPGNAAISMHQEMLEVAEQIHRLQAVMMEQIAGLQSRYDFLEAEIKVTMGTAAELKGIATWKTGVRNGFDRSAFQEAEPKLYEQYKKQSRTRTFKLMKQQ